MRYADVPIALQTRRVLSVDAVRGFSIFWIIGADGAVIALERMLRGKGPVLSSVGSLRAVNGVTVSTDLAGIISTINFESGAAVKKGEAR